MHKVRKTFFKTREECFWLKKQPNNSNKNKAFPNNTDAVQGIFILHHKV